VNRLRLPRFHQGLFALPPRRITAKAPRANAFGLRPL
jgi:hypothetical protein